MLACCTCRLLRLRNAPGCQQAQSSFLLAAVIMTFMRTFSLMHEQDAEAEESALDAKKRKRMERDPLHQGLIVQRSKLRGRDFAVDLASRLGKTQVRSRRR